MIFILISALLFLILWGAFLWVVDPMQHAIAFFANRTARLRFKDYLPVALLLVAGFFLAAFAADGFEDLANEMRANSPLLLLVDRSAHDWAAAHRSPVASTFFTALTMIGSPVGWGIIVAIVTIILAMRREFGWAIYLVFASSVGGLLVWRLKGYFARARPDLVVAIRQAHGYSFPSGHAMGSMITCGALAYVAFRHFKTWRAKAAALAGAATLILAISFSRIYLGVHWISDIMAGLTAGFLWITVVTVAFESTRRIRMIRELRRRAATTPASP